MDSAPHFIIIDDDPINNALCGMIIKHAFSAVSVQTFLFPEEALQYFKNGLFKTQREDPGVVFLDINMPKMDGWEFLDEYETLDENIRSRWRVYILSSSINDEDQKRALANRHVVSYLVKPMQKNILLSIAASLGEAVSG